MFMGSGEGGGMHIFDLNTNTWTQPGTVGGGPGSFRTNDASIVCESSNRRVTVFHYRDMKVYTFDMDLQRWTGAVDFPEVASELGRSASSAYYDDSLGVTFVFNAMDSDMNMRNGETGSVWVYRSAP